MGKTKQILYKPKKEKIVPVEPKPVITGEQVLDYLGNKLWEHRVFLLVTFIVLENVFLLVNAG